MRSSLLTFVAGFVALFAFCGVVTAVVMPYENLAARALALKSEFPFSWPAFALVRTREYQRKADSVTEQTMR